MKLLYSPTSPYARTVRIVLRERGLIDQTDEIVVQPYEDDPRLIAVNPAGLVPALTLDDGTHLIESILICEHLNTTALGAQLRPSHGTETWQDQQQSALARAMMDFALAATMEHRRTDATMSLPLIERMRGKIQRCFLAFENRDLTQAQKPSLADITIACALSYLDLRIAQLDWRTARPDLVDWHAAMEARPSFIQTNPAE